MALKLHNTLTRKKEAFKPLKPGRVAFYACGPTVYDAAHIGNLRTYVWEDVLRRWLEHGHGLKVKQVMNITDVEDKIIKASKAKTVADLTRFTAPHEKRFFADLDALGIERAEKYPKATQHVPGMIKLIERILKAGFAYERDGSVYFDVQKHHKAHGYSKLLKVDFAGFDEHHRIDNDEYDKENVQDFALWKAVPKDSPGWKSPWGHGRPGWHIECSSLVHEDLSEPIDIHAGGVDLIFPHHENEIAQTKAATGKALAKYWLHAEHLLVDGEKMAKSAKNIITLQEVRKHPSIGTEEALYAPTVLRLLFLTTQYRHTLNFTWTAMDGAMVAYERIQAFLRRLDEAKVTEGAPDQALTALIDRTLERFAAAMDDDLNHALALAHIFDFIRDANAVLDSDGMNRRGLERVKAALDGWDSVLGVLKLGATNVPSAVKKLADQREKPRQSGDFKKADQLRKKIEDAGYTVEDTEHGPRLRKK